LAAGISRVKGVKQLGFCCGNWLSAEQGSEVLKGAYGDSMRAKGISQNVVWYVVKTCCERAGLEHIAPHDLSGGPVQSCAMTVEESLSGLSSGDLPVDGVNTIYR
jgi:hypothetical protein